jgi:general stress protein 26
MNKIDKKVLDAARKILQRSDLCAFSTIALDGFPKMRYMGAFIVDEQLSFYLVCLSGAQKVREIHKNEKSQLTFWSRDFQAVVSLWGKASVVREEKKRREVYNKTSPLQLYPKFSRAFGVIRFVPIRLEYLNLRIRNEIFKVDLS